MIKAAIIGISGYGRTHLLMAREQARLGRLKLAAAVVINRQEEEAECLRIEAEGGRVFGNTEEMWQEMAGRIDLCFIPTSLHLHGQMTRDALRAGAHVLVEKPLTTSLAEANAMIAAAESARRFIAVGFQDTYTRTTRDLKARLLSREWGQICGIRITGGWPRSKTYYQRNDWAGRVRVGEDLVLDSPVSNGLAHFLNLALYLAGPSPAMVDVFTVLECDLWRARPIENYDTASLRLGLRSGAWLTMHVTHSCAENITPRIELLCERSQIVWTFERDITITTDNRPPERILIEPLRTARLCVGEAVVARALGHPAVTFDARAACEHVRVFSSMQTAAPVRDIPAGFVRDVHAFGEVTPAIREIEQTIAEAAERKQLFSELPSLWANPRSLLETR